MTETEYISRIKQLENEIAYLHGILDDAGISYRKEAKDVETYLQIKTYYLMRIKESVFFRWKSPKNEFYTFEICLMAGMMCTVYVLGR